MPGALRLGDMHVCPKIEKSTKVPHVGGPGGAPTPPGNLAVLVNGMPALTEGDAAFCVGPPDKIVVGVRSVKIGDKKVADSSASTDHGGKFATSSSDVLFG